MKKIAIFGLLILLSRNAAALDVCGAIPNGAVWSIADSPVNVICDLNIAGLTVEPGVEVHVTGDYEIVVAGVIRSLGTRELPVVFKPADDNATGWGGFFFEDTVDGSEFRWSQIEGATSSGVHLVRSNPSFDHVTFRGNSATHGGAIRAEILDGDLRITNSLFIDNFASTAGGAIYAVGPTGPGDAVLEVAESVFRQNSAGTTSGTRNNTSGGAIHIQGNSRILRSTFTENEARAYTIYASGGRYTRGGAVYTAQGQSEINATTFMGNACRMGAHSYTPDASRAYGGAVHLASGELRLSNSLLVDNELAGGRFPDHRGSGVYVAGGVGTIVNSTFVRNDTHAVYRDGGQVEILNSILFFNNNSGAQIAGSVLATYSDIQNGFPGEGNISLNPIFNELFAIVPPSPAIDAGNSSPEFNDLVPPGQGDLRNDMGYTGGPGAVFSAVSEAGPNQDVDERTIVTLDGSGSYLLGAGLLTYSWIQISGPLVNLSSKTDAKPTFLAPEVTEPTPLVFELAVSVGANDSVPDSVTVTVKQVNRVPTANAGHDQVVTERSSVTLDGTASNDPDGDALSYTWQQTSGPQADLSSTSASQPTFIAPDVEETTLLDFELVVSDGAIASAPDTVTVTVTQAGQVAPAVLIPILNLILE